MTGFHRGLQNVIVNAVKQSKALDINGITFVYALAMTFFY
jgi:hypothetical protein